MATRRSPTARHRRLIVELKRLRDERGLTREQVADRIGTSETSVFRYEKGETRPQPAVVASMLDLYEVKDAERDELLEMARDARKRGWWHRHRQTLKPGFDSYIGLEAAASVVRTYEAQTVPGLLQTEAYARANVMETSANVVPAEVEEKVSVRISRQDLVTRSTDPIQIIAVLDEAVLRRQVGGPKAMREQIRHLITMTALPNVVIHVLPFAVGAHPGMEGPFCLLSFPEPDDPDLVYLEQATSGLVPEEPEEVRRYTLMFGTLLGKALPAEESVTFMTQIAEQTNGDTT
ncbi:MAG: helix-turn-helix domain-containing protein [Streptosporangiaceae bacterium]